MYPLSIPGHVHPAARAAVEARWRSVNAWLWVATAVRVATFVVGVAVFAVHFRSNPSSPIVLGLLVVVQLGTLLWERDQVLRRTPTRWVLVALGTGFLAGVSTVLALVPSLAPLPKALGNLVAAVVVLVVGGVVVGCTHLAARRVEHPPLPEIGGTELRIFATVRHEGGVLSGSGDAVIVDADEVLLDAFGGHLGAPNVSSVQHFPLRAVRSVSVRAATTDEPPYATLPRGWAVHTLAGPVVQLDLEPGADGTPRVAVLPVDGADDLAALIRYRVWALTGTAPGSQSPARPTAPAPAVAPAAVSAPVRPVPVAVAAQPTVPSAVPVPAAWALGAAGVVGLPLLVVLLGVGAPRPAGVAAVAVLATAVGWVLARARPRLWPAWAASGALVTGAALLGTVPAVLLLLVLVASPALAWWGGRALTGLRPELGASGTVLRVALAAGGQLVVHGDRLVLSPDRGNPGGGNLRQDLHLGELALLQPGALTTGPQGWPLPGNRTLELPTGPALRVVGGGQQWFVSCPDPVLLARVIGARARRPGRGRTPLPPADWERAQQRARVLASGSGSSSGTNRTYVLQNSAWRWVRWTAPITAAWLVLDAGVLAHAPELTAALALEVQVPALVGAGLLAWGAGVERRLRPAEDHPLPPGAPPWGDPRPDHAPVPGWQPWAAPPGGALRG